MYRCSHPIMTTTLKKERERKKNVGTEKGLPGLRLQRSCMSRRRMEPCEVWPYVPCSSKPARLRTAFPGKPGAPGPGAPLPGMALVVSYRVRESQAGLCDLIANPRLVDSKPLLLPRPGVWESTTGPGPCFPGDLTLNTTVKGKHTD